jgi:hypothetical protein
MLQYFMNRAGKGLTERRKKTLEAAKKLMQANAKWQPRSGKAILAQDFGQANEERTSDTCLGPYCAIG